MLGSKHPHTLQALLFAIAHWTTSAPPDILAVMWRYTSQMADTVLGAKNPVSQVCSSIIRLGPGADIYEMAFRLIATQLEQALGLDHQETSRARDKYHTMVSVTGNYDKAERLQREFVDRYTGDAMYGFEAVWGLIPLGEILRKKEDPAGAEIVYWEILRRCEIFDSGNLPHHRVEVHAARELATFLAERGEYKQAQTLLEEMLEKCNRKDGMGERHLATIKILGQLEGVLNQQGMVQEDEELKSIYPDVL